MPQQNSDKLMVVQGVVAVTTIASVTALIIAGHVRDAAIVTGFAGLILFQVIGQGKQRADAKVATEEAKIDRQEIRKEVEQTKQHAQEAAAKVNGVTETALEELKKQCQLDADALEKKHAADIAALREEHHRERHDLKGLIQAAVFSEAIAKGEANALREQLAKYEQPPVPPKPAATEPGEANIP